MGRGPCARPPLSIPGSSLHLVHVHIKKPRCHFVTSTDTFELPYILYTPDRELPWTHGDRYERLIASPILDVLNINATIWGRGQINPHL